MTRNPKLARAVAMAMAGTALSLGAVSNASAHVMYNTYNAYASNIGTDGASGTDGWSSAGGWVGTAGGATPFGTTAPVVNWAAALHSAGGSLTVSSQDAHDDYGIWADIDTAKGAWSDGSQGWGHNTDVGLFKSDVATTVTIKATSLGDWSNFGISVFTGMSNGSWDHHGTWNQPPSYPYNADNPLGSTGLTYLIHDATVDSANGVTFNVAAGQVYSILLGGNSGPGNFGPHAGYSLSITSVPVPAAVWLFGSALAGMGVIGRRREKAIA